MRPRRERGASIAVQPVQFLVDVVYHYVYQFAVWHKYTVLFMFQATAPFMNRRVSCLLASFCSTNLA